MSLYHCQICCFVLTKPNYIKRTWIFHGRLCFFPETIAITYIYGLIFRRTICLSYISIWCVAFTMCWVSLLDVHDALCVRCSKINVFHCVGSCGKGYYMKSATSTCYQCPVGTYSDVENATSCTSCPNGWSTSTTARQAISECRGTSIYFSYKIYFFKE